MRLIFGNEREKTIHEADTITEKQKKREEEREAIEQAILEIASDSAYLSSIQKTNKGYTFLDNKHPGVKLFSGRADVLRATISIEASSSDGGIIVFRRYGSTYDGYVVWEEKLWKVIELEGVKTAVPTILRGVRYSSGNQSPNLKHHDSLLSVLTDTLIASTSSKKLLRRLGTRK